MRFKFHIVVLLLCYPIVSAHAGHIYHDTRVWAVQGPGGFYGLVEQQGEPVSIYGRTVHETIVGLGPLHFTVPCTAPIAALAVILTFAFVGWLAYSFTSRWKAHEKPRVA